MTVNTELPFGFATKILIAIVFAESHAIFRPETVLEIATLTG